MTINPIQAHFKKSTKSNQGNCVEIAFVGDTVLLRDSKDKDGAILSIPQSCFDSFLTGARLGQFNTHSSRAGECRA